MFGASLLSMMIHSGESDSASESWSAPRKLASKSELAAHLSDYREEQKEIPVIGRSGPEHRSMIDIIKKWDDRAGGSGEFGWGRVPVRFLVDQFLQGRHDLPASAEYIDLGTPLTLAGPVHNSFISDCDALLKKVGKRSPQVTVAIVDRGDESPGAEPEHFNHRIEHVDKTDIVFSDHASQVLWLLLDRLHTKHNILDQCDLICALVKPPTRAIGLKCFEHANAVEMLSALNGLSSSLSTRSLPVVVNMSWGMHVGPHNGDSPVEGQLHQLASSTAPKRFFFVAGGNDGGVGIAGRRDLVAGQRDYLKVRIGQNQPQNLLIELWWEEQPGSPLSMEVQLTDVRASGTSHPWFRPPLTIGPNTVGSMMKQIGTRRSVQFSSLFHTRAHNNMCCAAFAITCSTGIPTADIVFSVKSPADVTVNGWVVVSDDPLTHFLEAGNLGSLRVPSTDSNVICVTGVVDGGQGWDRSSRGPAAEYGAGRPTEAPRLAHRVELGKLGESGTSFASARACADAAHYILNNPGPVAAHTPTDLALALLGLSIGASHNSRTGFGALLS